MSKYNADLAHMFLTILPGYQSVDPALPRDVQRLTLAYTLFDVTERMAPSLGLAAVHSN